MDTVVITSGTHTHTHAIVAGSPIGVVLKIIWFSVAVADAGLGVAKSTNSFASEHIEEKGGQHPLHVGGYDHKKIHVLDVYVRDGEHRECDVDEEEGNE